MTDTPREALLRVCDEMDACPLPQNWASENVTQAEVFVSSLQHTLRAIAESMSPEREAFVKAAEAYCTHHLHPNGTTHHGDVWSRLENAYRAMREAERDS